MRNRIKSAFNTIHAEDSLKTASLRRLHEKMQDNVSPRRYHNYRRWTVAMAVCLVLVLFPGILSYSLYFSDAAYIDLDINPSLSLTINRFDRVIKIRAYNKDAEALLTGLDLRNKKAEAAMDEIIAAAAQTGALQEDGLVSVTVQSVLADEEALFTSMQNSVEASVAHHCTAEVDVFPVDSQTRDAAAKHHVSPAKYLAILELQEVDPTATVDRCKSHSIGEIRQMTDEHVGSHHGENAETEASESNTDPDSGHSGNAESRHHGREHE